MSKRILPFIAAVFFTSISFASKDKAALVIVFPDVTARGRALYEYDQAAWHASDAVQATHPSAAAVGRYIARKSDSGWSVSFGHLNDQRDKFMVGYEAIEGGSIKTFTVKALDPPSEDTSFNLAAAKAIDKALADFRGEDRPYNVAVLPAEGNKLYVYVLPAQTKPDVFPLGGDARYLVSADGESVLEKRQMHKSVIEVAPNSLPKGTTAAASWHTHVLSNEPEDTDVFHVLTRQPPQPEFIGTMDKKLYTVSIDGSIRQSKL